MRKRVMTVLGPVIPADLGVTDAHNHLWIEPVSGADPSAPVLTGAEAITQELNAYREVGGGAIVDCQPFGCGRNGRILHQLSQNSGVHIIAATGFHRRLYYPPDPSLWRMTAVQAAALFVDELTNSLHETNMKKKPVRAGFIKIAGEATLADTPTHLLEAAAHACRQTGCAIEMHTEKGSAVEDFLHFFLERGVLPKRLVFCHVDKRPDFGFHREIAQTGAMLEYDTFYRPKYNPEQNVWPLLKQMADAGLTGHIALATDMADAAMWQTLGDGPGLTAFITQIQARLQAMGVPETDIQAMLGGNISRRLAYSLPTEESK